MKNMNFHPLTPERWQDFEKLFGPRGAYAGCWCMWWRLKRTIFEKQQGDKNRLAMKAIVDTGRVPGIIGYVGSDPVGWCSVAPRSEFGSLNRSRVLKAIDNHPVWSIVCFFVSRRYRQKGVGEALIVAAVEYVRGRDGKIVEAYPSIPKSKNAPPTTSFMGFPSVYEKLGFKRVAQPSPSKCIMRFYIDSSS